MTVEDVSLPDSVDAVPGIQLLGFMLPTPIKSAIDKIN
jgi:hypothetical protein